MLCSDDDHLHPCLTEYPYPLFSIKGVRIEQGQEIWSPLPHSVSVKVFIPKMDEGRHLKTLPCKLASGGDNVRCHSLFNSGCWLDREFNLSQIKLFVVLAGT